MRCNHNPLGALFTPAPLLSLCRYKNYFYYTRTLEGAQYAVHCRRALAPGAPPPTEADVMDESIPGERVSRSKVGVTSGSQVGGVRLRLEVGLRAVFSSSQRWHRGRPVPGKAGVVDASIYLHAPCSGARVARSPRCYFQNTWRPAKQHMHLHAHALALPTGSAKEMLLDKNKEATR